MRLLSYLFGTDFHSDLEEVLQICNSWFRSRFSHWFHWFYENDRDDGVVPFGPVGGPHGHRERTRGGYQLLVLYETSFCF